MKLVYEKLSIYSKTLLYLHPVYLQSLEKGCINLSIMLNIAFAILHITLGTKTNFFSQTGLVSSVLTYIAFSIWIYEETKNIFWASEIVATLTHVERFYDLMNLKLFYFAW